MMNLSKRFCTIVAGLAIGTTCIAGGEALAVSITATANDDGTNTIFFGPQLQDGDFSITANPGNPVFSSLGDGRDEFIRWNFDFNTDPALMPFQHAINSGANLIKAELTFNLRPVSGLITTDSTWSPGSGVPGINIPAIPGVVNSLNQDITFTLDLFNYGFNTTNILNVFNSGTANSIPWGWQDDVIMYSASLTLETTPKSTPEPGTILGILALGALCISTIKPRLRFHNA